MRRAVARAHDNALHRSNGRVAVVEYLLDLGLDVSVRLQDGATGMHLGDHEIAALIGGF
jgi:hypothetical protein